LENQEEGCQNIKTSWNSSCEINPIKKNWSNCGEREPYLWNPIRKKCLSKFGYEYLGGKPNMKNLTNCGRILLLSTPNREKKTLKL